MTEKRPVRDRFEEATERVPRGPRGFFGEANALGGAGVGALSLVNTLIPSPFEIGYEIESHTVDRFDDREVHTFRINAALRDIAESAAKFFSVPSNVDFAFEETEVVSTELIEEKRTFSTWEIVVEVRDRNIFQRGRQ